jgi:hypothetical protein
MQIEISGQVLEKYSKAKFYENPPRGSRVVFMRMYWQTDMTAVIVAFGNLANATKNSWL